MAHHLGICGHFGPTLFPVPPTVGNPFPMIPAGFDDADHLNGAVLEPAGASTVRTSRATWIPATGDLARLLTLKR